MPYTPWLPQEHGGEPTAAAAYATAEAAAKARGTNNCGEVRHVTVTRAGQLMLRNAGSSK